MQSNRSATRSPDAESPAARLLRLPMVIRITGLGRSTIYRQIAEKKFAGSVRIGDHPVAWRQTDVDRWREERPPST